MPELTAQHASFRTLKTRGLADALHDARCRLLQVFDAFEAQLPAGLEVRYAPELNPPRWELGHIAWFEEHWIARNTQRLLGATADPEAARAASCLHTADALYNSSAVAHTRRWHLDLPSATNTRRYAQQVRARTLALLGEAREDDQALYFFRLVLAHEDMHREAWAYMAQNLGLDAASVLPQRAPAADTLSGEVTVGGGIYRLGQDGSGSGSSPGFAFDNELGAHDVELAPYAIDTAPITWARYLPAVIAGACPLPRHLRHDDGRWSCERFGHWIELDPAEPAVHISRPEALAWCTWAGRRLPSEAEWEHAALQLGNTFEWGQVWEWTASAFAPYPGFTPHPYRDYSQPWFDGRPVLRGASFATAPRLKSARFRNYFPAERNDIFAGFRSCHDARLDDKP